MLILRQVQGKKLENSTAAKNVFSGKQRVSPSHVYPNCVSVLGEVNQKNSEKSKTSRVRNLKLAPYLKFVTHGNTNKHNKLR